MNIVYEGSPDHPITCISLSRKNLEGLLVQLGRAADLPNDAAQIMRRTDNGVVVVVAEEDDKHYEGREGVGISDGSDFL